MIVDTSAVVALAFGEPEAEAIAAVLEHAENPVIGALTLVELQAVMSGKGDVRLGYLADRLLIDNNVETVSFTAQHAELARRAYRDYGRGSGHPAALNFGDCLSYAIAAERGEPLLFVGKDFSETDLPSAL